MRQDLQNIYNIRFSNLEEYRNRVWKILVNEFFSKWVKTHHHILDLGCGYGEFINNINCKVRHAMDLNPKTGLKINDSVIFHEQDCSQPWNLEPHSLDIVFTSNFFEHLADKISLEQTIEQIRKALKPGGILIAMGPNIAVLKGKYWDFWDHHVALSDSSIQELLEIHNFSIEENVPKFLPYNMVRVKEYPLYFLSIYLKIPFLWKIFGRQFLIVGKK